MLLDSLSTTFSPRPCSTSSSVSVDRPVYTSKSQKYPVCDSALTQTLNPLFTGFFGKYCFMQERPKWGIIQKIIHSLRICFTFYTLYTCMVILIGRSYLWMESLPRQCCFVPQVYVLWDTALLLQRLWVEPSVVAYSHLLLEMVG